MGQSGERNSLTWGAPRKKAKKSTRGFYKKQATGWEGIIIGGGPGQKFKFSVTCQGCHAGFSSSSGAQLNFRGVGGVKEPDVGESKEVISGCMLTKEGLRQC